MKLSSRNKKKRTHKAISVGDKTRQNPGLSPFLVFFSDLEIELLTSKFLFLICFEFCFENLEKKFKANVLICVGVKLDKIWVQCIESKKKFFLSNFFFRKKKFQKNLEKNAFFRRKKFFDSIHRTQILSNFTLMHIKTSAIYFFLRFKKKNSKKIKNKIFKVKSSTPKSLKNTKMGLNPGF